MQEWITIFLNPEIYLLVQYDWYFNISVCGLFLVKKNNLSFSIIIMQWLESEIMRLSHLRDRASEKGRRKEYPFLVFQFLFHYSFQLQLDARQLVFDGLWHSSVICCEFAMRLECDFWIEGRGRTSSLTPCSEHLLAEREWYPSKTPETFNFQP